MILVLFSVFQLTPPMPTIIETESIYSASCVLASRSTISKSPQILNAVSNPPFLFEYVPPIKHSGRDGHHSLKKAFPCILPCASAFEVGHSLVIPVNRVRIDDAHRRRQDRDNIRHLRQHVDWSQTCHPHPGSQSSCLLPASDPYSRRDRSLRPVSIPNTQGRAIALDDIHRSISRAPIDHDDLERWSPLLREDSPGSD